VYPKWDDFLSIYGDLPILKMADVYHLEFSKFGVCYVISIAVLFCLPLQNFSEIRKLAAELWPKTIVKMADVCHLEF